MTTTVAFDGSFEAWRKTAGELLRREAHPTQLIWPDPYNPDNGLFDHVMPMEDLPDATGNATTGIVKDCFSPPLPRPPYPMVSAKAWQQFLKIANRVCYARYRERFNLLYRLAWRMRHGEPQLPDQLSDSDMLIARHWDALVRRDAHKAKAFIRFKLVYRDPSTGLEHFSAWHRPTQYPLRLVGSFFADRFSTMRWTIFTPDEIAAWDGRQVHYSHNVLNLSFEKWDNIESLWITYYAHIFNPARLNVPAMLREMPKHFWGTLPEAAALPELIKTPSARSLAMREHIDIPSSTRTHGSQQARRPTVEHMDAPMPDSAKHDQTSHATEQETT